ncbi:hypothetical protein VI817_006854 [Penicillium citrinum]|nr:hypothetical protein VI817_006854 [Penicillium citrinum]
MYVAKRRGRPPKSAPRESSYVPPPNITKFTKEDAMLLWYAFRTNGRNPFPDYAELGNILGLSKGGAQRRFYRLKSYFESVNTTGGKSTSPNEGSPAKIKDSKSLKKKINDWSEDEIIESFKVSSEEPPETSIKIETDAVIKSESDDDIKEDRTDI